MTISYHFIPIPMPKQLDLAIHAYGQIKNTKTFDES
jgi:hypothetical protein